MHKKRHCNGVLPRYLQCLALLFRCFLVRLCIGSRVQLVDRILHMLKHQIMRAIRITRPDGAQNERMIVYAVTIAKQ